MFDTLTHTWSEVAAGFGLPRWNHAACAVEAIPNWKVFVFGGSSGDLSQSAPSTPSMQGAFQQVRITVCQCLRLSVCWPRVQPHPWTHDAPPPSLCGCRTSSFWTQET
jgi:hypothetical protein